MKVPGDNVVQMPQAAPQIDQKYLLMAAAQMHSEGRLVESGSDPMGNLKTDPFDAEDIKTLSKRVKLPPEPLKNRTGG